MIHQKPKSKASQVQQKDQETHFTLHSSLSLFSKFPSTLLLPNKAQTKVLRPSQETMMPAYGVTFSLILLLFLATVFTSTQASLTITTHANGSAAAEDAVKDDKVEVEPLVPLIGAENVKTLVMNETRRRLGSFQICALCTCCGGAKGLCLPSPCCYAINCNIPNRPFGFCSFTPKTCNCLGCHI